jgi:hypothetical protein
MLLRAPLGQDPGRVYPVQERILGILASLLAMWLLPLLGGIEWPGGKGCHAGSCLLRLPCRLAQLSGNLAGQLRHSSLPDG